MLKNIKRAFALILVLSMLFLVACGSDSVSRSDDSDENKNNVTTTTAPATTETPASQSELLLPTKLIYDLDGEKVESDFAWSENGCKIIIGDYTLDFVYNELTRSITFSQTANGETFILDDFCVFDDKGRLVSMNVDDDDDSPLKFSYNNDKITVLSCPDSDATFPLELPYDKEARKILLPPFEATSRMMFFNEYGDIYKRDVDEKDIITYEYDEFGNILEMTGYTSSTIAYEYGNEQVTSAWQNVPLRVTWMYTFGFSKMIAVSSIICKSLA